MRPLRQASSPVRYACPETSSSHKRGKMVMFEGALITAGIMISYWIDLGFSFAGGSVSCELQQGLTQ